MRRELQVRRTLHGRIYERQITELSRITSNEAKTMIGITLRHLYHLVELGILHPFKKKGHLYFKYREIEKFVNERR